MPMYGKIFAHTFEGSLYGKPLALQAIWAFVLSKTNFDGFVELNPQDLAHRIGGGELTVEQVKGVIKTLCSDDPESRSQEAGGARLRHEGGFTYYVINSQKYRAMVNEEDRREYQRIAQQESRARKKAERAARDFEEEVENADPPVENPDEVTVDLGGGRGVTLSEEDAQAAKLVGGVVVPKKEVEALLDDLDMDEETPELPPPPPPLDS